MSEELNLDKELEKEELVRIKEQLTMMKVKFHHNANLETLKKLLAEALEPKEEVKESTNVVKKTAKQIREEAMKLVRCNVICHDPMRKSRKGEFITVGNSIIGTFRVFVPYNGTQDVVWHIPRIVVDILKRKTCIKNVRQVDKGHQHSTLDDVQIGKAFDIVELPPLTPEELKELAETQKALGYSISAPNQYAGN
ncbi:hypothetical protein HYP07_gp032 [Vibrio phage JSF3]|uniref:Uncharacterized protein n=3 Tax=Pacinivirus TaxID=2842934 RepID=A0A0B5H2P1_9CAUD|nr:hypothetical protein M612_gp45 [Vibrio phage JA-1]YP_009198597.1 hypothetical protein AVV30_gp079 [Vibrio phage phi 1]YP_009874360.1 hypothetical protein HYO77_gp45 [Vibrio phage VCO139]YP_009876257.1 hypothetical protein HYP07_gp032 [Vibrio phage JSF3]AGI61810.1 hypothetical protein JA1_0058 [Vibrio phage JA-1]AGI61886.1 hypothetical protein VCO139_0059 [Vibrio phage VCO139]AJF40737.1 hypothetical protein SBVP1_0079 [Vibrio phage phi 1]APD18044.1 hypothetical protein [Vibrio phage JSF3]